MSYHSEMMLVTDENLIKEYASDQIQAFLNSICRKKKENIAYYHGVLISWERNSEGVLEIYDLIDKIEDKHGEDSYAFIRLGEDPNDIETGGDLEEFGIQYRLHMWIEEM